MNNKEPYLQETMWAELKPDCYNGPNCDEIKHQWNVYAEGDKQDDTWDSDIILSPKLFPPGTRVVVKEPHCPKCDMFRERNYETREFAQRCDCGFDWDDWVRNKYE